jgi:hypothetical protein
LERVLDLPRFPLTGFYVDPKTKAELGVALGEDTALLLCSTCGHGQLEKFIDPDFQYGENYLYRTSMSGITGGGMQFFDRFLRSVSPNPPKFDLALELGSNDLTLLKHLRQYAPRCYGIDPIWKRKTVPAVDGIRLLGAYVQDVDLPRELEGRPDLVVSAHTLEHLENPREVMSQLMDSAADNALFVVEVPSLELLLANLRFDHIFHQHVSYFSLASLVSMLTALGGEYIAHAYHPQYWGSLSLAFRKGPRRVLPQALRIDASLIRSKHVEYKLYAEHARARIESLHRTEGSIVGYGASQILPSLAYFWNSRLEFLECIYDDDQRKNGLTYPELSVIIASPAADCDLRGQTVLITATDHARPIMQRLAPLAPKRIVPVHPFL